VRYCFYLPPAQLFDTTYTDSQGNVYDGNSGWYVCVALRASRPCHQ